MFETICDHPARQGERLGEGDAHVIAPSPDLSPSGRERNMKMRDRINDAKSGYLDGEA
jgi:hypothetical protein